MVDRLLDVLEDRIRRFVESRDATAVLNPAALEQASQLWQAVQASAGSGQAVPVHALGVLAYLHLCRCWVLPERQRQEELRTAMGLCRMLADHAPKRVSDHFLSVLAETRLVVEGDRVFDEYQRAGHPEMLDQAVA